MVYRNISQQASQAKNANDAIALLELDQQIDQIKDRKLMAAKRLEYKLERDKLISKTLVDEANSGLVKNKVQRTV